MSSVDDAGSSPCSPRLRRIGMGRWLLPIFLFITATLGLGGDLGKYSDDYDIHCINPVTGQADWGNFFRNGHGFVRLFHWHAATLIQTLFWRHDWVTHTIGAFIHALASLLLWRLLRRLGADPVAAAVGALIFVACPFGIEGVFWSAAHCAIWGAVFALVMFLCVARAAQGTRRLRWFFAAAIMAFLTPFWYEQVAPWAAAVGLVFLAAVPRVTPIRERLIGMFTLTAMCGVGSAGYIVLTQATIDPTYRMSEGSLITPSESVDRLHVVVDRVFTMMSPGSYTRGGFAEGWRRLGAEPMLTTSWLALLSVAVGLWLVSTPLTRVPRDTDTTGDLNTPPYRGRLLLMLALGAAMFALPLLPIAVIRDQMVDHRMVYAPCAGAAVVLVTLLTALIEGVRLVSARRVRAARLFAATLGVFAAVPCAITCLGVQSLYQRRSQADLDYARQLREFIPDPPKDAVFVPLQIDFYPVKTGEVLFDYRRHSFLEAARWSISYLQHVYARDDIAGIYLCQWLLPDRPLRQISRDSLGYLGKARDPDVLTLPNGQVNHIAWARIVPFIIDDDGVVHLVDRLRILRPTNDDFIVDVPVTGTLAPAVRESAVPYTLLDAAPELPALTGWIVDHEQRSPDFRPSTSWGLRFSSTLMHSGKGTPTGCTAMSTIIKPSAQPRRVHFRAAMADWAVTAPASPLVSSRTSSPAFRGDGVTIIITLDDSDTPLATLELSPQTDASQRGWAPLTATIPPMPAGSTPHTLRVRVLPGPSNNASYDVVFVTPGLVEQ